MFLYRVLSTLALLIYAPYALVRSWLGRRRLGDLPGRLGRRPYPDLSGGIWVHAVSVGEVGVARSLIAALRERAGRAHIGLSVTTAAGRELAERLLADTAPVFAFPFDLAGPVESALSGVHPGLVVLTETEIWPLFLERAAARGIPVALVNGRISPRSFSRYRLAGRAMADALSRISLFAMQSVEDARRIEDLGAPADRITVTGNIKFDIAPAPPFSDAARLKSAAGGRPILVGASTGEGEEATLLEAWRPVASRSLLALAPRRPERFDEVAALIERSGFSVIRRSRSDEIRNPKSEIRSLSSIYLLDSIGELAALYGEASLAFVGGSLRRVGGHNPIEAWAQGVPVVVGPHVENFRDITAAGEQQGFLTRVGAAQELPALFGSWVADPLSAKRRGETAKAFVAANRGAVQATAVLLVRLLDQSTDRKRAAP
jgi:3-deoxy-D-manno-octulosonic-acid transferase